MLSLLMTLLGVVLLVAGILVSSIHSLWGVKEPEQRDAAGNVTRPAIVGFSGWGHTLKEMVGALLIAAGTGVLLLQSVSLADLLWWQKTVQKTMSTATQPAPLNFSVDSTGGTAEWEIQHPETVLWISLTVTPTAGTPYTVTIWPWQYAEGKEPGAWKYQSDTLKEASSVTLWYGTAEGPSPTVKWEAPPAPVPPTS